MMHKQIATFVPGDIVSISAVFVGIDATICVDITSILLLEQFATTARLTEHVRKMPTAEELYGLGIQIYCCVDTDNG